MDEIIAALASVDKSALAPWQVVVVEAAERHCAYQDSIASNVPTKERPCPIVINEELGFYGLHRSWLKRIGQRKGGFILKSEKAAELLKFIRALPQITETGELEIEHA